MTSDDQLRDALRAEANTVEPSAEGYTQIKDKIARRRRLLVWQRSAVAAVAAMSVVAVAVVVFTGDDGKSQIGVVDQTPTPSETGTSASASPSPTGVPVTNDPVAAVWPFTSRAEIDAWTPTQYPALTDARTAALGFMNEVLGKHDFTVSTPQDVEPNVVQADVTRVDGNRTVTVATVTMRNMGTEGPWVVLLATNERLSIATPTGDAVISSPLSAKGSINGVDEQVLVEVREAHISRQPLGTGNFRGGTEGWAGSVAFSGGPGRGAVFAHTGSFIDGKPVTFAATPVRLAANTTPAVSMPSTFVAIRQNRIALFTTSTGAFQRYLTTEQPGGGVSDLAMAPDGTTVYFVRAQGTCAASIHAVSTTSQTERTVVAPVNGVVPSILSVSGDGTKLGYVKTQCQGDGNWELVLRTLGTQAERSWSSTASAPESGTVGDVALNQSGSRLSFLHYPYSGTAGPNLRVLDTTPAGEVLEDHTTRWQFAGSGCRLHAIDVSPSFPDVLAACLTPQNRLDVLAYRANGTKQTVFSLNDAGGGWGIEAHHDGPALLLHGSDSDTGSEVMYPWIPGRSPQRIDPPEGRRPTW